MFPEGFVMGLGFARSFLCAIALLSTNAVLAADAPRCGTGFFERKYKTINWETAMRVTFQVDSDTSIKGVLCAGRDDRSGYALEYFSFKTDAGFEQVYPVASTKTKKGLVDRATTVFSNEDVAKISTLGSYAIRSGALLTIKLDEIELDDLNGRTEYRLKLRFPEEMGRTIVRAQPQTFHEMSLSVFREHEHGRVWATLPESKEREATSLTIEIDSTSLSISRLVLVAEGTEFLLKATDFPVMQGAAAAPNTGGLNVKLAELAEADKGYDARQREQASRLNKSANASFSLFGPIPLP